MRWRGAVGLVALQLCTAMPALPPAALSQVDARTLPGPLADLASALSVILIPKIFADVTSLRDYIRSEEFALLRMERGDLRAVDAIFEEASRLCWGNRGEALYVTAMATMDHRKVGVRVPELGPFLWFPLTSEFEDDFADRVARLPSALYPDSPPGPAGDRDKLQHFFGSAFLTFLSGSIETADEAGRFVEWGEGAFIVDGLADNRDFRADRHGQDFGLRLQSDPSALPSESFRFAIARLPLTTPAFPEVPGFPILQGEQP
jgi:hypothetical protein